MISTDVGSKKHRDKQGDDDPLDGPNEMIAQFFNVFAERHCRIFKEIVSHFRLTRSICRPAAVNRVDSSLQNDWRHSNNFNQGNPARRGKGIADIRLKYVNFGLPAGRFGKVMERYSRSPPVLYTLCAKVIVDVRRDFNFVERNVLVFGVCFRNTARAEDQCGNAGGADR